jgi:hypothetical protein
MTRCEDGDGGSVVLTAEGDTVEILSYDTTARDAKRNRVTISRQHLSALLDTARSAPKEGTTMTAPQTVRVITQRSRDGKAEGFGAFLLAPGELDRLIRELLAGATQEELDECCSDFRGEDPRGSLARVRRLLKVADSR